MELLNPGDVIFNRFEIEEPVGAGGQAFGFRARNRFRDDVARWPKVFVKQYYDLPPSSFSKMKEHYDKLRQRLSRILSYVCLPIQLGVDKDSIIAVYRNIQGMTLEDKLTGGATSADRLTYATSLAQTVSRLDREHIAHLDLKPQNVMVERRGEVTRTQLIDFDAALVDGQTIRGNLMGTPGYLSPEHQGHGNPSRKSDVFVLGVMIYELFFKENPFHAHDVRAIARTVDFSRASLPPGVATCLQRCLAENPGDRPDSGEVFRALSGPVASKPVVAQTPPPAPAPAVPSRYYLKVTDGAALDQVWEQERLDLGRSTLRGLAGWERLPGRLLSVERRGSAIRLTVTDHFPQVTAGGSIILPGSSLESRVGFSINIGGATVRLECISS